MDQITHLMWLPFGIVTWFFPITSKTFRSIYFRIVISQIFCGRTQYFSIPNKSSWFRFEFIQLHLFWFSHQNKRFYIRCNTSRLYTYRPQRIAPLHALLTITKSAGKYILICCRYDLVSDCAVKTNNSNLISKLESK